jgi:addiction module RelE/StbE family toxin
MKSEEIEEYSVIVPPNVENDLDGIISYIAQDSPQAAIKILNKLEKNILSLKYFPARGRWVPELLDRNIKDYRELIVAPWRIIYKIEGFDVHLLTVIDGRRNVEEILITKLLK